MGSGGYAEYVAVPDKLLMPIPKGGETAGKIVLTVK